MIDFENLKRPVPIMLVCAVVVVMSVARLLYVFTGNAPVEYGNYLPHLCAYYLLMIFAASGLWKMKKWGFILLLMCYFLETVVTSAGHDNPIRFFIFPGLPHFLIVFACTFPHRKKMN